MPKARVAEAHGQMDEAELEQTMLGFLRGDADCLVTTTIIESGLDIPTANTLIVERADRLGLAQAYQIRGRVGRSRERAFAYLLYPSAEALTEEAAARLSTLADHTELGSGFKIAMRDLDIRGAGDLLGEEQSGHVAAVGFELYCQMIDEAVAERAGEAGGEEEAPEPLRFDVPVDAYLPASYIPFEAAKIDVHRRIVAAREPGAAAGDPRRARRPLRPAAARGREPAGPAAGADRAAAGRGRQRRAARRAAQRHRGRARLRAGDGALGEQVEGALYEWREKTASVRVPDDPGERLDAVLAMAGRPARCVERKFSRKRYAPRLVSPNQGRRPASGKGGQKGARGQTVPGPGCLRRLALLVFGARLRRPLRRRRGRRGHRRPEHPLR